MSRKKILIIDSGCGNLTSLGSAVTKIGMFPLRSSIPVDESVQGIVIPGQGRFSTVITQLIQNGWIEYLEAQKKQGIPILGICVGMQILFESSEEDDAISGLSWFSGRVRQLNFPKSPMIGWSQLQGGLCQGQFAYFVNSYAIEDSEFCVTTTEYGVKFCAAIQHKNVTAVQFHPEKSSTFGLQLMQRVLNGKRL